MVIIQISLVMSEQQDQQVIQKYLFIITPLEIISNSKIKSSSKKSVLIKLGNKTVKCTQFNVAVQLEIEVLYSKTLHKYCPIKGIIKIYDVSEDGSEIISSVGGFQTDQLLNQATSQITLNKEIGTSKLKMDIHIINKSHKENTHPTQQRIENKTTHASSPQKNNSFESNPPFKSSMTSPPSSLGSSHLDRGPGKRLGNPLLKLQGPRQYDLPHKNTSSSINKSLQKINQALNFKRFEDNGVTTRANEVLVKAEVESLKQQLQEEKRKSALLQDKCSKTNLKLNSCKAHLWYLRGELKGFVDSSKEVLDCLELNEGVPSSKVDGRLQYFSIRFKEADIETKFPDFIVFLVKKVREPLPEVDLDLELMEAGHSRFEVEQNKKELGILKKLSTEKDKKIVSLQRQIEGAETTIRNLKETNRHLAEENRYLREKNEQIQINLFHKETTIEAQASQLEKINEELQQVDNKLYNSTLEIEELKEEVSNCQETIERYRVKYGDLKNVKNRAIEMEIKECLRWIELQNRDLEMSEIQETTPSEHEHEEDKGDSLSQVIRNIEIQKVPKEEMSIIRDELLRILEKVDSLMAK